MAELCECDGGGGNLGLPNCYPIFDVTQRLVFVEYYKADGTVNDIDLSALTDGKLDQTFLDSKVKALNPKDRWYFSPEILNVTDERADDITESFDNGTTAFIQEGARTFNGLVVKGDPILLGNLKKWKCRKIGVFYVDKAGKLIGKQSKEGFLSPVLVQDGSFSVGLMKGSDTTLQKVSISFIVSQLEDDADLKAIGAEDITADLQGVTGLLDAAALTPTNITTTGFDVQINTSFGTALSPLAASGMELADFYVFNTTTSLAVAPTSVTESAITDGLYTFVLPAQTAANVLNISNPVTGTLSKNYDLKAFEVVIP